MLSKLKKWWNTPKGVSEPIVTIVGLLKENLESRRFGIEFERDEDCHRIITIEDSVRDVTFTVSCQDWAPHGNKNYSCDSHDWITQAEAEFLYETAYLILSDHNANERNQKKKEQREAMIEVYKGDME